MALDLSFFSSFRCDIYMIVDLNSDITKIAAKNVVYYVSTCLDAGEQ